MSESTDVITEGEPLAEPVVTYHDFPTGTVVELEVNTAFSVLSGPPDCIDLMRNKARLKFAKELKKNDWDKLISAEQMDRWYGAT